MQCIENLCQELQLPDAITQAFLPFCRDYEKAAKTLPVVTFTTFLQAVAKHVQNPYQFPPYHAGIDSYYQLGLDFLRPLVDFSHSKLLGKEQLHAIDAAIKKKENVILLANHQAEIDPQLISLLIEKETPELARDMIFVAGHRVTTDPLAVPLSLGRNLLCIYSKRHIEHPPEKKEEKLRHNTHALKVLQNLLNEGGKCIYIAPSGGRDRASSKGEIEIASFDPDSVEMFYLLSERAKRPSHLHPLSLKTYDLLPPPEAVLAEIGEARHTRFAPVHLFFGEAIDMEHIANCHQISDKHERRQVRAKAVWQQVVDNYKKFG